MRVVRHVDRAVFLDRAEAWLQQAEVENGLMLGLGRASAPFDQDCYFATVEDDEAVVACAVRTPPYGLIVTRGPEAALDALVEHLADLDPLLPSVVGPEPWASQFAVQWAHRLDRQTAPIMRMRVFKTTRVVPPPSPVPGALRPATEGDLPTVTRWVAAFHREAHSGSPLEPALEAQHSITQQRMFIWEHQHPVSIAMVGSRTDRGARIGLAYTPPDLRGRGYASACVGGLTRRLLDEGAAYCCITTDITNATTNKIYPTIGYQPVCDTANISLNAG